ncbi:uncharacterized protein LOC119736118 [Patiria miniata]|uniref:Glycosyltransferase family 92 protein n=1 Tax=Patiria miniata TaxID=46514 RepID=A0A914AQX7_PATMI|nr:uncharacterized protein LOC119736118 [Patiria miniata]
MQCNMASVSVTELGRLVRVLLPRVQYFQPRRRGLRTRCRLLVLPSLAAFGFVQVAWMFLAFQDGVVTVNGPERARRLFDGGIKLDFYAPARQVSTKSNTSSPYDHRKCNLSTCSFDNPSSHTEKLREKMNATDPKTNPTASSREEIRREENIGNILTLRTPWCSGRGTVRSQPVTSKKQNTTDHKYFLTAVLLVRIYASDPAKLTTREMMQWLQYLNYAGVQHVYVYDAYFYKKESQRKKLGCFIKNGYVTYVDWSHKARPKYTIAGTQVAAYQKCLDKYGHEFAWQVAIDIDEYPYCPGDHEAGFLDRAVRKIAKTKPNVVEISMLNYLYLGKPLNDSVHPLLIDRLWRRTIQRANALVKPIYQPKGIAAANVHHNSLRRGYVNFTPKAKWLRMSHFWGDGCKIGGRTLPKS